MIDFELDWVEEADRAARLANETNHCKKRKINGYNSREDKKDTMAIEDESIRRWNRGREAFREEYTE